MGPRATTPVLATRVDDDALYESNAETPVAVAVDDVGSDEQLAYQLQAEEDRLAYSTPAAAPLRAQRADAAHIFLVPPPGDVILVESYYGPKSALASLLLFCIFPPCALVPCLTPCDSQTAVVLAPARVASGTRRRRQLFVRVRFQRLFEPGVDADRHLTPTTGDCAPSTGVPPLQRRRSTAAQGPSKRPRRRHAADDVARWSAPQLRRAAADSPRRPNHPLLLRRLYF
mmetsp:Transcript_15586/g.55496  ORF Transcript_15586/g.55496 Transcript_15586/m.55496 type:complete len:229 (+) Transcript_15586:54-740(+)